MTEEEIKAAQEKLEADRKQLEADREKLKNDASLSKVTAKYKAEIKALKDQISDRDETITQLLDGAPAPTPAQTNGNSGDFIADFKKLLRY